MSQDHQKHTEEKVDAESTTKKTHSKSSTTSDEPKTMDFEEISAELEKFFTKTLPAFPKGLKEFLVKFIPWINLIIMIFALPIIVVGFGLGAIFSAIGFGFGGYAGFNPLGFIGALISLAGVVLTVMALPGLFKRQYKGWQYSYWSVYVSAVASLINGSIATSIFAVVFILFVNFYVLFQIKEYYKKDTTEDKK